MQQSVIYQEWREEFLQEGEQIGEIKLILRQLSRRIGELSPEMRSQIQALSLDQLESLGEALLDFTKPNDLNDWMRTLGA
jgi:predicted transposase YdaD